MKKQTITYLTHLDVALAPETTEVEHKIKVKPELTFDELFESGEYSIDEQAHLTQ